MREKTALDSSPTTRAGSPKEVCRRECLNTDRNDRESRAFDSTIENRHSQVPTPIGGVGLSMRKTSPLLLAVLAAAAVGVAGCQSIPTDRQLSTFATATIMVATVARDTLSASNAAVVTRKLRERAELGGGVDDALFTPLIADEAYARRIEFLDAWERYATALEDLASADRSKAMEKAITQMAGALDALGKHYASLSGNKKPSVGRGALKEIVNAIGGEITEAQRREGLRRAMAIQHTVMQDVLPALRDELSPAGIFGTAHLNQAEGEKATLMSRYNVDHEQKRLSKNPDKRLARLHRIREAWARAETIRRLYGRLQEAVEQLIIAEQALYDATTGAVNREHLFEAVGRAADQARAVSRLRKRLKE